MRLFSPAALLPALLTAAACNSSFCQAQALPSATTFDLRSASVLALDSAAATPGAQRPILPPAGTLSTTAGNAMATDLPESPAPVVTPGDGNGQIGKASLPSNTGNIAGKWSPIILPGQTAQPLSDGEKVIYAFRNSSKSYNFFSIVVAATYSQGANSAPHYGQGWAPYGQRIGAAAARNTIQTLAGAAVFAPLFHDDPRYYELGPQHKPLRRIVYAATRVVITRSDTGHPRANVPLLAGYAVAAGVNNLYYPDVDRTAKTTVTSYFASLGGAVIGLEINEFLDDALRLTHLQRFHR